MPILMSTSPRSMSVLSNNMNLFNGMHLKDRQIHIHSLNLGLDAAHEIAQFLFHSMADWDSISITSIHCQYQALQTILQSISAHSLTLKSFSIHSVYFGCLNISPSNGGSYCLSRLFSAVQSLEHLNLSHISIDSFTAIKIMQSIAENAVLMTTLKVLNLSGNPIIGESQMCIQYLCKVMVNARDLRELYLKSCSIHNDNFQTISQFIVSRKLSIEPLEILDLADSCYALSPQGVVHLVEILKCCSNLRSLNLSHRNIHDHRGGPSAHDLRSENDSILKNLKNHPGRITKDKMKDSTGCFHLLWTALCTMHSLEALTLSYVSGITLQKFVGAGKRSKVLMKNLIKLEVRYSLFQRNMTWPRANRIYHVMSTLIGLCPNLQEVNLGGNYISDKQLKILHGALSNLTQFRMLDLSGSRLTLKKGCHQLYKMVMASRKNTKRDVERKVAVLLKFTKGLPREVALDIIDYTNECSKWREGLCEIVLLQNSEIQSRGLEGHKLMKTGINVRCVQQSGSVELVQQ